MSAEIIVEVLLQERTLRDFRQLPDDQLYLCSDQSVAERHKLQIPFKCGSRQWIGGGLVKIEFYSNDPRYGRQYQVTDYASIKSIQPVPGEIWQFDILPKF